MNAYFTYNVVGYNGTGNVRIIQSQVVTDLGGNMYSSLFDLHAHS